MGRQAQVGPRNPPERQVQVGPGKPPVRQVQVGPGKPPERQVVGAEKPAWCRRLYGVHVRRGVRGDPEGRSCSSSWAVLGASRWSERTRRTERPDPPDEVTALRPPDPDEGTCAVAGRRGDGDPS